MKEERKCCEHIWKELEREKRVVGYKQSSFFSNGMVWYEMRILQQCQKCGLQDVISF